jgi:hypothetical protein
MTCKNCGGTGICETEPYEGLVSCWECKIMLTTFESYCNFWELPYNEQIDMVGASFLEFDTDHIYFPIRLYSDYGDCNTVGVIRVQSVYLSFFHKTNMLWLLRCDIASRDSDFRCLEIYLTDEEHANICRNSVIKYISTNKKIKNGITSFSDVLINIKDFVYNAEYKDNIKHISLSL